MLDTDEQSWMYEPENAEDLGHQLVKIIKVIDANTEISKVAPSTSLNEMTDMYLGHYRDLVNG